jgi:penicillin-binding protein 1A
VVEHGTATQAKVLGRHDIAGKTGTTNDQVDAWFAGYNSQVVTTTWFGYDTPHPLHEYGATLALPLWIDYMKIALKKLPEVEIKAPTSIVSLAINPLTGLRVGEHTPGSILEFFSEKNTPAEDDNESENTASYSSQNTAEDLF